MSAIGSDESWRVQHLTAAVRFDLTPARHVSVARRPPSPPRARHVLAKPHSHCPVVLTCLCLTQREIVLLL